MRTGVRTGVGTGVRTGVGTGVRTALIGDNWSRTPHTPPWVHLPPTTAGLARLPACALYSTVSNKRHFSSLLVTDLPFLGQTLRVRLLTVIPDSLSSRSLGAVSWEILATVI